VLNQAPAEQEEAHSTDVSDVSTAANIRCLSYSQTRQLSVRLHRATDVLLCTQVSCDEPKLSFENSHARTFLVKDRFHIQITAQICMKIESESKEAVPANSRVPIFRQNALCAPLRNEKQPVLIQICHLCQKWRGEKTKQNQNKNIRLMKKAKLIYKSVHS
jgi:hypothetical protein